MKHIILTALAGSGMLLMTLPIQAQYQPRPDNPQYQREAAGHNRMFDQIRDDLNLASTTATPYSGDRDRVALAQDQVNECQHAVNSGEYDSLTFSQTISSIQRVIDLNRMTDRNRDYLVNDVGQLRNLQAELGS
jgi:hypothetical protein